MSCCYFVYGNLKVNPFIIHDSPLPGFKLITYDHESWVDGVLWDIGHDAGYTEIGKDKVYGQLWLLEDASKVGDIRQYCGVYDGLSEEVKVTAHLDMDEGKIEAMTFRLTKIDPSYKIIKSGKWLYKRI